MSHDEHGLHGCTLTPLTGDEAATLAHWACTATGSSDHPEHDWLLALLDDGALWGHRRGDDGTWRLSSDAFPGVSPAPDPTTLLELRVFGRTGEHLVWRTGDGDFAGRHLMDADTERNSPTGRTAASTEPGGAGTATGIRYAAVEKKTTVEEQFTHDPLTPLDDQRVLIGDRVLDHPDGSSRDGFTLVGDATGSRQVVPLNCAPDHFRRTQRDRSSDEYIVTGLWPLRLHLRHYLQADPGGSGTVRVAATRLVRVANPSAGEKVQQ